MNQPEVESVFIIDNEVLCLKKSERDGVPTRALMPRVEQAALHAVAFREGGVQVLEGVARGIAGVGLDTPSIDHGPSKDFIAHQVLMGAGIYALENLDALEALPARGARLYALPMKIGGGSGGPVRVIAVLP